MAVTRGGHGAGCQRRAGQAAPGHRQGAAKGKSTLVSVRAADGQCDVLHTAGGHERQMELSPTAVNIVSGCKEPLTLSFDDNVGVTLTSHKKLVMDAKEGMTLYTPKKISFQAHSRLLAKKRTEKSGFAVESDHHVDGKEVKNEGTDRSAFPPYEDEPQHAPPPPPPEPPFDWGMLAIGVLAGVAIVALSVVTFGAGAVLGAAAIGAAVGAIGGVVATAVSDIGNNQMSSGMTYLESALKGAAIGAICGAIFGPIGGGAAASLMPKTAGQLALEYGGIMTAGGVSSAADYTLHEMWDGRAPQLAGTITSFSMGAAFAGGLGMAAPWMVKALERMKASKGVAKGKGKVQTGGRELSVDEYLRRLDKADEMYESFRKSNVDVQAIAKNTGMAEHRVQRIKEHLFFKEHIKEHGVGRFEADYEIAQAWDRLQKGTYKQNDIDLLNHELFESKFEGIFKTDYRTAHDRTVDSGRPWHPPEEE